MQKALASIRMKNLKRLKVVFLLVSLLSALSLPACTTTLSGQAEGPQPADAPYKQVLIVAPDTSQNARVTVERRFVHLLGRPSRLITQGDGEL